MKFISYRIITNGVKYHIEGKYTTTENGERWLVLSTSRWGCEASGFIPFGEIYEFDSKELARDWIKTEYGLIGIRALESTWYPIN